MTPVDGAQRRLDLAKHALQRWQYNVHRWRSEYGERDITTRCAIQHYYEALDRVWECQCMMKGTRL